MKRILIALVSGVLLVAGSAAPAASASYLYLQKCREGLHGVFGDNDVAAGRTYLRNSGFSLTDEWHWRQYVRESDSSIIQFVGYVRTDGFVAQLRFRCHDVSGDGLVQSGEDYRF